MGADELRRACASAGCSTCRADTAEAALADLRHKIDGIRFRLLDRTAHVTEGPNISRIKVESWLRELLEVSSE